MSPLDRDRAIWRELTRVRARRLKPEMNRLFAEFNAAYFGGRLPAVKVKFSMALMRRKRRAGHCVEVTGQYLEDTPHFIRCYVKGRGEVWRTNDCNPQDVRRTIELSPAIDDDELRRVLIHEMIHAAGFGDHDEAFAAEARRLREAGAPVEDKDCA